MSSDARAFDQLNAEALKACFERLLDCFGIYRALRDAEGQILDFEVLYVNPAACENNLLTREEQIGRRLTEILPGHLRGRLMEHYVQVVERGETWEADACPYSEQYAGEDEQRWFDIRAWKLDDGFACVWRNVTDREQAKRRLHRLEADQRSVSEGGAATPVGLVSDPALTWATVDASPFPTIIHAEDGEILQVNAAWLRLTGYSAQQLPTIDAWTTLAYGEGRATVKADIDRLFDQRAMISEGEYRIRTADGSERVWDFFSGPIGRDGRGRRLVISTAADVTERRLAEDRHRREEERLRLAAEAAGFGTYDTDVQRGTSDWSEQLCVMHGYRGEVPVRLDQMRRIVHPEDCARFLRAVDEALDPTGPGRHDLEYRTIRNGEVRWVRDVGRTFFAGEGSDCRAVRVVGTVQDVTERKEAEQTLRDQTRQLHVALSAGKMGIWVWDLQADVVRTDATHRELWDLADHSERLPLETILNRVHPDDRGAMVADPEQLGESTAPLSVEFRVIRRDGSVRWLRGHASADRDASGRVVRVVGVNFDITQQKQAAERLQDREHRLSEIFENAAAGLALCDPQGRLLQVNSRMAEIVGYDREQLLSMTTEQISHPEDFEAEMPQFQKLLRGEGDSYSLRKRYVRGDGGIVWVQVSTSVRRDSAGEVRYAIGAVQDITEAVRAQRELEEINATLEARVDQRTELIREQADQVRELAIEVVEAEERERKRIAGVLHDELQQLLAAARMRLGLLRRKTPQQNQEDWTQLDHLVDDAIASARSLAVDLSPPVLRDGGAAAALDWLAGRFDEKHDLTVHVDTSGAQELRSESVGNLVFQAARECLFNVVKHAQTDEAWVTLRSDDQEVRLTVRDQGRGCETVTQGSGTGLGLFGLTQRVQRLGGWSRVETAPGEGCAVTLAIPQTNAGEGIVRELAASDGPISHQRGQRRKRQRQTSLIRVVVVDDHVLLREGLAKLLAEQDDVEIVGEAESGVQAVEVVGQLEPDVVLMDVSLPDIDGIEATRRIKMQMPEVRVVGLSMHDSREIAQRMRDAGASGYVLKGGPSEVLLEAIRLR